MAKSKQAQLDKLKEAILKDNVCPELAAGATQLVFGDGSADADIVFIGEAPGKNEDQQGLPFVGAAGRFLNEMLASIGLERGDIYITNIVKYRPPNNRDPLPEEKQAFLPYLKKQLLVINPKLIVTLGRHSMETLLPGLKISQVHGQPKRIKVWSSQGTRANMTNELGGSARKKRSAEEAVQKVPRPSTAASDTAMALEGGQAGELVSADSSTVSWVILPLFHPAAALYNGGMRATLLEDFARIPLVLAKI